MGLLGGEIELSFLVVGSWQLAANCQWQYGRIGKGEWGCLLTSCANLLLALVHFPRRAIRRDGNVEVVVAVVELILLVVAKWTTISNVSSIDGPLNEGHSVLHESTGIDAMSPMCAICTPWAMSGSFAKLMSCSLAWAKPEKATAKDRRAAPVNRFMVR